MHTRAFTHTQRERESILHSNLIETLFWNYVNLVLEGSEKHKATPNELIINQMHYIIS